MMKKNDSEEKSTFLHPERLIIRELYLNLQKNQQRMQHPKSRILVALICLMTAFASWAQSINISGHKAVQDSINNIWLCSVPHDCFGSDWAASVETDSTWTKLVIDGTSVTAEDTFTFQAIEGGKQYPFTAQCGDETVSGNITFTWLPVLEVNGEFGNEYTLGTVSLNAPDISSSKEDMLAKLKWRGGVTNTNGKHKRNYHIKFVDANGDKQNRRLLGMRKDNHWKLDAGQIDPLRVRNRVLSDLWLEMSRAPWHKSLDSTVVNGSRGKVTEVILNGKYHGIYGLIEPVDRKQLALVKYDEVTGTFHGEQWVAKQWARTYTFPMYNNNSATWNGMEVSYPDVEDVFPTDWSTIYNSFEFARSADYIDDWQTFSNSLDDYFDTPVMEDYFIFVAGLQIIDNEYKNIYYSCYDKTLGQPRLTMTPWDLDISVGAKSLVGMTDDFVSPERGLDWYSHLPVLDMFFQSAPHRKQTLDRYWELRKTYLNTDSLIARFQRAVDELEQCGAAAREEARWSGDSDINGKTLDISAEMEYIADWITRRMNFLDNNIFKHVLLGDVNDDGIVGMDDLSELINYLLADTPINEQNADIETDGSVNMDDLSALINYLLTM